jgi:hypothetical protein
MRDSARRVKVIIDKSDHVLLVFVSNFHVQTDTKSQRFHYLIRWIQSNDKKEK